MRNSTINREEPISRRCALIRVELSWMNIQTLQLPELRRHNLLRLSAEKLRYEGDSILLGTTLFTMEIGPHNDNQIKLFLRVISTIITARWIKYSQARLNMPFLRRLPQLQQQQQQPTVSLESKILMQNMLRISKTD